VGFEPSGDLRHLGVVGLLFAEADEAAAAGDLEGPPGSVDGVRDVHGRSLADSLPGLMSQSAVVRDYRTLEVGRRRANRLVLTVAT
jgi:hypothetical protein